MTCQYPTNCPPAPPPPHDWHHLPMTGLDVTMIMLGAVLLVLCGLLLRQSARRRR